MQKITDIKKGIYILELYASSKFNIEIKKFSGIVFPRGYYYYVGSAQKNFGARIMRHLRKEKTIHWHIDHLTVKKNVHIKHIFVFKNGEKRLESELASKLPKTFGLIEIVNGFGNSDTKNTNTHLFYSQNSIYSQLLSRYHSAVAFTPSSTDIS